MYEERNEDLRKEYKEKLNEIPEENLVYLDESGFDVSIKKEYGYSKRGERLFGEKSGNRKNKRITVISALLRKDNKLIAPMYFKGKQILKCLIHG